jgi:hypothetical protein
MMIDRRVPYVENVCAVAMFMSPIKEHIYTAGIMFEQS